MLLFPREEGILTFTSPVKIQKEMKGKKKMRKYGKVEIPQEAFIAALKADY